jgi:hypothetical protein
MPTLTESPQRITDYWTAGLKLYAIGRNAGTMRAIAADPVLTRGFALVYGITEDEEKAQELGIADAIDQLAEAGMTRKQAYFLAGLDKDLGPYPGEETATAALAA